MTPNYKILMISVAVAAIIGVPASFADISTTDYGLDLLTTKLTEIITQVNANTNQLGNMTSSAITGEIKLYAGTTAPEGYFIANGVPVSRTAYSDLFAVIGTTYGVGNGATTFNLPDLKQKFPRGGTPGNIGGDDTVALTITEMPRHTHSIAPNPHRHMAHIADNSGTLAGVTHDSVNLPQTTVTVQPDYPSTVTGQHWRTDNELLSIGNTGSGNAHENLPSYLEIMYIIKY